MVPFLASDEAAPPKRPFSPKKRSDALADVLDFRKIINTEEKRRGVEAVSSELVARLSYYERWTVAFANILFEKSILTPEQLARKMVEVAARYRQSPTTRRWRSPDDDKNRPLDHTHNVRCLGRGPYDFASRK
jgi:hypothetical protein